MKNKKKQLRVEVKQIDIDRGKPKNPWRCPIARAVRRATNYRPRVAVEVNCKIGQRVFVLPSRAETFVEKFDDDLLCSLLKPFTFVMEEKTR